MKDNSLEPEDRLPIDAPERRRLPVLLRRSWFRLNQAFRRRIAEYEITPDQFTVLRTMLEAESEGLIQSELTARMSSDPNTIASLLERMEKAGWLERKRDERDRRAFRIRLKAAGRRKYNEVRDLAVRLQQEVLDVLPESEREHFLENLAQVADACGQAAESSPKKAKPAQK